VLALACGGWLAMHASPSHAADHLDSPNLMTNPLADINDVYAWMTPDALNVNLAMSVSPADPGTMAMPFTRHFSPTILYVFHVTSIAAFGMTGTETKVICRINSDTNGECWVGNQDYVNGDPSNPSGTTSKDGKVRLFAGLRSDPFFFDLQGLRDAVSTLAGTTLTLDTAGCPQVTDTFATNVRKQLQETPTVVQAPCTAGNKDCFATLNAKLIVLSIDKSLLNLSGHEILSVWASTNMVAP
jgi:hypothetical protein